MNLKQLSTDMIILPEFQEYSEYTQSLSKEPLKITAYLSSPYVTTDYIFFDGVLSSAVFRKVLGEDAYLIPENKSEVFYIPLPLKKIGNVTWFWSASVGFPGTYTEGVAHWRKQTDIETKKRIAIGSGQFKRYDMPIPYTSTVKLVFYAFGNLKEVEYLLTHYVPAIGKKRSQGFGTVREWIVERTDYDWSVVKDGVPMRPIPISSSHQFNLKCDVQMYFAYRPPYWHRGNLTMCYMPLCKV